MGTEAVYKLIVFFYKGMIPKGFVAAAIIIDGYNP